MVRTDALDLFRDVASRRDAEIDLTRAALVIAAAEYPDLDIDEYVRRVEALGRLAEAPLSRAKSDRERVNALIQFLRVEQRFTGNQQRYDDPRNSYLNDVLDRKLGIPITLALVYMEVGRHIGLDVVGVGFPGHFLARVVGAKEDVIVDAFSGTALTREACRERLRAVMGRADPIDLEQVLRPSSSREILKRMLTNLKLIALRAGDHERALAWCERIVLLTPGDPLELRDRGLVYEQIGAFGAAIRDFGRFLELAPEDPSARAIELRTARLHARIRRLH